MNKHSCSNNFDTRKYEKVLADVGAEDYEKHVFEWELEHRYFISARWGKKFQGLFLDYGCGTGLVSRNLVNVGREVIATDISRNMCKIAKEICEVQVVVADGLNLPFRDNSFSVICISGVLHHLRQNLEKAFCEIGRCTKKALCMVEPSITPPHAPLRPLLFLHRIYMRLLYYTCKHVDRKYRYSVFEGPLSPEALIKLCKRHNFRIDELRFFNHIPSIFTIFLPETTRKHLIRSMISPAAGTDVEIIAKRN